MAHRAGRVELLTPQMFMWNDSEEQLWKIVRARFSNDSKLRESLDGWRLHMFRLDNSVPITKDWNLMRELLP
jgi:hypothetical protein